jgi:hypothetical protein
VTTDQLDLFADPVEEEAPQQAAPAVRPIDRERIAATAGRRSRPRRAAAVTPVRFDFRVGCGSFGWLVDGDARRLCETRLFHGRTGAERAVLVALVDGETVLAPADGSLTWEPRTAEAACDFVGFPPPETVQSGDLVRRIDLFHVERHRSARWAALVEAIRRHRVPCSYSLRAWGRDVVHYVGAADEDPERFAAAVNERVAQGAKPFPSLLWEIAADAEIDPARDATAVTALLDATGWTPVLDELRPLLSTPCAPADAAPDTA